MNPSSRLEVGNGKYIDDQMANGIPDGGSTGQVLAKTSNADYDVEWVTGGGGGSGTVTSVQLTAGTGISLSGTNPITTSGNITITNSSPFTSPLTTKGDIYVRNASVDTRLPVGLDTQMLVVDSTTSTGLKWTAQPSATPLGYYGAWQDDVTQTAASSNVGYAMIFRTADITPNGISIANNGSGNPTRITFANTGVYNIQFGSQFQNSDTQEQDVTIWLRKNGVDVPGSSGFMAVVSSHGGTPGHVIAAWNYVLEIVAGDYYELIWSTTDHVHVTMQYYTARNPPPAAASVILTVTQQSGIMAGTGITAINSLTGAAQTLSAGTSGTDFSIISSGTSHTFNLPTASATNRGALSSTDWSTFNSKQSLLTGSGIVKSTSGTISYLTDNSTNWDTAYADRFKWDGGSTGLTASTGRTSLGATTVGGNLFTLTNPSAITFLRINADNSVSTLDAATFRTAIGAGTSSTTGTVTSVAALTLGTSGTDLSSTVANGTTTPVITLNVPDASATARGVINTNTQTIAGAKTFSTAPVLSSLTASQILALDASNNVQSLTTATYPSLTELSYVKGVTSSLQTQIGGKGYTIMAGGLSQSVTNGATIYFGHASRLPSGSGGTTRVYIPQAGAIKAVYLQSSSATAGTSENWTMSIRLNNTTNTSIATTGTANVTRTWINSALNITVAAGDYIEITSTNPTWATPPGATSYYATIYIQ